MIHTTRQLPLDLKHRPALDRDAFLVTDSNAEAVGWIDRWPAWPMPALVLQRPERRRQDPSGERLARRVPMRGWSRVPPLDAAAVPRLLEAGRALVIEQADRAAEQPLLQSL